MNETSNENSSVVEKYQEFVENKCMVKSKRYYVYSIFLSEQDDKLVPINLLYVGKGIRERYLHHFRVAYACLRMNIIQVYKTHHG